MNRLSILLATLAVAAAALVGAAPARAGIDYGWAGSFGFGPTASSPAGIAVAPDRTVYTITRGENTVWEHSWDFYYGYRFFGWLQLSSPSGLAIDAAGDVYVASGGNRRIVVFDSLGEPLRSWGTYGPGDGQFLWDYDVDIGPDGNVYVLDSGNTYFGAGARVEVFTPGGTFLRAFSVHATGNGAYGLGVAPSGDVYVADTFGNRVVRFTADGTFLGATADGVLSNPLGVDVAPDGRVFVASGAEVYVFDADLTLLGSFGDYNGGGHALTVATDVTVDSHGDAWVTDQVQNQVHRFGPRPTITVHVSPAANAWGWWNTNVSVTYDVWSADGITATWACDATTYAWETSNGQVSCMARTGFGVLGYKVAYIRLDKTAPTIRFWSPNVQAPYAYAADELVDVRCNADDALSGVRATDCRDGYGSLETGPAWAYGIGTHDVSAAATDYADNTATASMTFSVFTTPDITAALVGQFVANPGIANSLTVKLKNADKSGQMKARADVAQTQPGHPPGGQLGAFVNEVRAQAGKALTTAQANALIDQANALAR